MPILEDFGGSGDSNGQCLGLRSDPRYSSPAMANDQPQIAFLAAYPPPFGGVASHIVRLGKLLDSRNVRYRVYNAVSSSEDPPRVVSVANNRVRWLLGYVFSAREELIYILSDRLEAWLAGAIMAIFRRKRVVVRLRNSVLPDWIRESPLQRAVAGWALRRMAAVVCVSETLARAAEEVGVGKEAIFWAPGFLPPEDNPLERAAVAPEVFEFMADRGPVIAANGKVDWYHDEDLYGLDQLVELVIRLVPDYPNLGLVVCFWEHRPDEEAYVQGLLEHARENGAEGNILLNRTPGPFVPVLAEADLFIRPTNTDGDANSIREALWLGVPAVASDVVERPPATSTFRCRDLDDLERKVREALVPRTRSQAAPEDDQIRADAYVDFLLRLCGPSGQA